MNSKYAKITKNQIEIFILPFIPTNKCGFSPTVDLSEVVQCIIYKLKTGVQWYNLFIDLESIHLHFLGNWFIIITENGQKQAFFNKCLKFICTCKKISWTRKI